MAQLVKPDIQSNPIGETSPNDFFNPLTFSIISPLNYSIDIFFQACLII